ncbi:MAG: YlxR family protein [Firmicutes bacterium]|nr:YlxR family protein [Bacillota bacterium]
MTIRKVPMRTCVACTTTRPKKELVRVVRTVEGQLLLDRRGKVSGRGAYLCPSLECVEKALKSHRLERALEVPLTQELVEELRRIDEATV